MSVPYCNLCGAPEGERHAWWQGIECPHLTSGKHAEAEKPDVHKYLGVVAFKDGIVAEFYCKTSHADIPEGGPCGCSPLAPPVLTVVSTGLLVTYPDGGLGPMTWKHPEANRERTAATDSVSSRCSFCNADVASKRLRCSACGYRGDR